MRPRFAGDGRLRLPATVHVYARAADFAAKGDIVGEHADAGYDPFERLPSGLLLVEEFARADLTNRKTAEAWYREHGVLDLAHYFPADPWQVSDHVREDPGFHDAQVDVLQQQENVRWHLASLTRLTDHVTEANHSGPELAPTGTWDPRWVQPVLRAPSELVWLGGSTNYETHIKPLMQRYARPQDVIRQTPLTDLKVPFRLKADEYERWWVLAHATYQRLVDERVPVLWVPELDWYDEWSEYEVESERPTARFVTGRLSSDWWGLAELERRLLTPYVKRAAEHTVEIRRAGYERDLTRAGETMTDRFPGPLMVYERRWWTSLLAPVYLQLLEGLRRVTEGQSGAAICRECGQPFLTLDARRSSFCTDRDRFRFSQRERRRRLNATLG